MNNKRTILVVNDDGIQSDGIRMLAQAAQEFGDVWVIAPDSQRSAMSHRITCNEPIQTRRVHDYMPGVEAYACSGTPADCVRISSMVIGRKPDVVLSGINFGYNISGDLQYSATAGAALEGAFQGMRAIAFSRGTGEYIETVQHYLKPLIEEYIDQPLSRTQIWNINFPDCTLEECRGIRRDVTVAYDCLYHEDYSVLRVDADTVNYQVMNWNRGTSADGTDLNAVTQGYVSVGIVSNLGSR